MAKKDFINFRICKVRLIINPLAELILPEYKGSTLRGGFGYVFKRVSCQTKKYDCSNCSIRSECLYCYVFETPVSEDSLLQQKNNFAPHPFVIELPLDSRKVFKPTDNIYFDLILIGEAIKYLPYFILAFIELGKVGLGRNKIKYSLEKVEDVFSLDEFNAMTIIYERSTEKMIKQPKIICGEDFFSDLNHNNLPKIISINFLSPTRIKYEGKFLSDHLTFHILVKNLLRRISALSYFHCHQVMNLDFTDIINFARNFKTIYSDLHWYDWERFSTRQKTKMKLGGFKGIVSYELIDSDITRQLLAYIRIGELIHVGKGASFGLGQYKLLEVS